jgi:hypothetical protein
MVASQNARDEILEKFGIRCSGQAPWADFGILS